MKTQEIEFLTIRERSRIVSLAMNVLRTEKRLAVLGALCEGNSIMSTERMTGIHRDTIMRLMVRVGEGCARMHDKVVRRVYCQRVQCDEIWTFVQVKQARLNGQHNHDEMGDQFVFVGMDGDTKFIVSYLVGKRDAANAFYFMNDLKDRLARKVQLTTDGFRAYLTAVEDVFGADVDYAQLVKLYGQEATHGDDRDWYNPVTVLATIPTVINGRPDPAYVSTSYVERQNLTIRMQLRRFTRLTNAFSKKLANLKAAVALHFAHYNFVRFHSSLRATPAMAQHLTDHIWSLEELMGRALAN